MEATLKFNLPEDQNQFDMASHGIDFALVCLDMEQKLRTITKYNSDKYSIAQMEVIEKLKDNFFDIMQEHNVNTDMIQ